MANLGLACRGNGRQGNIAHGDGLIDGRRRTQAGELTGERVVGGQVAKQRSFFAGVRVRLVICLGFWLNRRVRVVDGRIIRPLSIIVGVGAI